MAQSLQVTRRLAVAVGLAVACFAGHLAHMWPGQLPAATRLLASSKAHAAMSLFAMLGELFLSAECYDIHIQSCFIAEANAAECASAT